MATQIQIRRDTSTQWTSVNPTLANGEQGYETDTKKMKVGDGVTAWTSLAYFSAGSGSSASNATTTSPGLVQLAGDLAGTATSPVVAKLKGLSISGTPASGKYLDGSGVWTTLPSGGGGGSGNTTGVFSVKDYGAVGDGSTNDTAAINNTIAAVHARTVTNEPGGIVYFPPGVYNVASAISVPNNVMLVGEHPYSSRISYVGSSSISSLFTFGTNGVIAEFVGLEKLWVDLAGKVQVGATFYSPQEGSRVKDMIMFSSTVGTIDVKSGGGTVAGGSNKFVIDGLWAYITGDSAAFGVRFDAGSGPCTIRDTTLQAGGRSGAAPANSAGVVAATSKLIIDQVNCEQWESHTYGDGCHLQINLATSTGCTYGIKTSTNTDSAIYMTNGEYNDTTAVINDQSAYSGTGLTIGYCRSYWSESYPFDQREFRRNFWEHGSSNVMTNSNNRTQLGYRIDADSDQTKAKFGVLIGGSWYKPWEVGTDGNMTIGTGAWNGSHLRMGNSHIWIDGNGRLRIKATAPTSDTDGSVVGAQS